MHPSYEEVRSPILKWQKNPHASRQAGKGSKARAANLSKQELSEQGHKAVLAGWARKKKVRYLARRSRPRHAGNSLAWGIFR